MRRTPFWPALGRLTTALGLLLALAPRAARADDSWDAIFIAGKKVGHNHIRVQPLEDKGRKLVRVLLDQELEVKRQNDRVTMRVRYGTIETPTGEILRLDTRLESGQEEIRTHGSVVDGKMVLKLTAGGRTTQTSLPWAPEVRGPYAVEQSLAQNPMKAGETRTLREFIPNINVIGDHTLMARQVEEIDLGAGARKALLRIDSKMELPGQARNPELDTTFWVDDHGQIFKSYTDVFGGFSTYRTTAAAALSSEGRGGLDLIQVSFLKVTHKIPQATSRRDIVYRLTMPDDNPTKLFPEDRRQTLKASADGHSATMQVKVAGPDDGTPGPEAVDGQFLRANPMIDSQDPTVISLAQTATRGRVDPWQKSVAIEEWVFDNMTGKNFKTAFASAKEVARTRSGDCTEHSVLTAAMCRASGIPARVVVGLVYVEEHGAFGFHMWNEVYVNRRWVAIDSTFKQAQVDATHLKLADASLDGVSPYEPFLGVARVFSKLTLEPTEIR